MHYACMPIVGGSVGTTGWLAGVAAKSKDHVTGEGAYEMKEVQTAFGTPGC